MKLRWWRKRKVKSPIRRTRIDDADFDRSHRAVEPHVTEEMVRRSQDDDWKPPPPATRDPWRPRTTLD